MPTLPLRRLSAVLVGLALTGMACSSVSVTSHDGDPPRPTPTATTTAPPETSSSDEADETPSVELEPVLCAANELCPMMFELDGLTYEVLDLCDPVALDTVGDPIRIPGRGSPRLPTAVHALQAYPVSAGVAVDFDHCEDRTLALPSGHPDARATALVQARLRCEVLRDPPPEDRCDRGGDAQWRVGDALEDEAFAPFPEFVTDVDAAIAAGRPEWAWRTDPLEVATRHYEDENVCNDAGTPCPWEVALTEADDQRAVVEGIVKPFPNVTWDIRLVIERLGERSWWATRMTVEPRPAG